MGGKGFEIANPEIETVITGHGPMTYMKEMNLDDEEMIETKSIVEVAGAPTT